MSTNQAIFLVLSIILFTILTLVFYKSSNSVYDSVSENQAIINATGFGQALIEEITLRSFDEKTIGNTVKNTGDLTSSIKFGTETGENNIKKFDDLDDFHDYTKTEVTSGMGNFDLSVKIDYVSPTNVNNVINSKSFLKKITVLVDNQFLKHNVKLEYVVGY